MNSTWSKKWKKLLIWFSGYASFVAFALVGGYVVVKNEDEDLKKTAKTTFVVVLIFAALSALFSVIGYVGDMALTNYYSSGLYDFCDYSRMITSIAQIAVYVVFIVMTLFEKEQDE